jgi:hypothetical protein
VKVSSGVSYLDRAVFLNLLCAEMLDKLKKLRRKFSFSTRKSAPDCGIT